MSKSRASRGVPLANLSAILNTIESTFIDRSAPMLGEEMNDGLVTKVKKHVSELMSTIQQEQHRIGAQTKCLQEALEKARVREENHQRELESLRQEKRNIILENAVEKDERLDEAQIKSEDKLDKLRSVLSDLVGEKRDLKRQLDQERATVSKTKLEIAASYDERNGLVGQLYRANTELRVVRDKIEVLQPRGAEADNALAEKWKLQCERLQMEAEKTTKKNEETVLDLKQRLAAALEENLILRAKCGNLPTTMHAGNAVMRASLELLVKPLQPETPPTESQASALGHGTMGVDHQEQRAKHKDDKKMNTEAWHTLARFANTQSRGRYN